MKKLTVKGIMGKMQGINKAKNPQNMPSPKRANNVDLDALAMMPVFASSAKPEASPSRLVSAGIAARD